MNPFVFENPTKIRFGEGAVSALSDEIVRYGKTVLFLYGCGSIHKNGVYESVKKQLDRAGVTVIEHSGVQGNPRLSHAREGVELAKKHKVDLILAVGGGSVIDESKAIAAGALYDGDIWEFYAKTARITGALPIISVLTLPATASEMNGFSVLTNDETREKWALGAAPITNPRVSFLDPAATVTLSAEQSGFAAADIIAHCTEGYFTTSAKELLPQDEIIEGLVRSVAVSMDRIVKDPADIEARASLMWSATLGWNGIAQMGIPGMGLPCHALEMPLSGIYDIAHGAGLSIITPVWLAEMAEVHGERIIRFGERCLGVTGGGVPAVVMAMESLYRRIGAPLKLSEVGVFDIDIPRCTADAFEAFRLRGVTGYDEARISRIYSAIL